MLSSLPDALSHRLESFLTYGTSSKSEDEALMIRRARGFALIGVSVVVVSGVIPAAADGLDEVVWNTVVMLALMVGGLALGFVQEARWVRPITHLGMGAMLMGIVSTAIYLGGVGDISATFPVVLVLASSYVLGVRASAFWTLMCVIGVGAVIYSTALPLASDGPRPPTRLGFLVSRSVVLFSVFALAAVERRFGDRQSAELRKLARQDALTGLNGRRAFEHRFGEALARAERYERQIALIAIDLNGFKLVNDTHGHATGDEVLREVARRIADRTRATDMASRMGGDEFLILLEEVEDGKQVEVHAKRLLDSISEPIETGSHSLRIGAAAGIAVYPEASRSREGLTHAADLAMYAAKARGENAICVYDDRLEGSLPAQAGIL